QPRVPASAGGEPRPGGVQKAHHGVGLLRDGLVAGRGTGEGGGVVPGEGGERRRVGGGAAPLPRRAGGDGGRGGGRKPGGVWAAGARRGHPQGALRAAVCGVTAW